MDKVKQSKSIALVGMPGCFKSTVGKILAEKLSRTFYDSDALYCEIHAVSIGETFKSEGEAVFRAREAVIIAAVSQKENAVIATGGGAVLRQDNTAALKANCVVIELCASVPIIFERIKNDVSRPLLADMRIETVEKLYAARKEQYGSAADFRVDTEHKKPDEIANEIIRLCKLN